MGEHVFIAQNFQLGRSDGTCCSSFKGSTSPFWWGKV